MKKDISKPFVLVVSELIYSEIYKIKKKNSNLSNLESIERFIGSKMYQIFSSGKFHDDWFEQLKKDNYFDKYTGKKITKESIRLLEFQKDAVKKQLIKFPNLYYAKSHYPLEISQRAFNFLWRSCETYELWCKETKQLKKIKLNIID
tara:strand:- start:150 stop:590 length:441 start_codon:yes stop_codon:yes gene_type:complete